jgi:hypothetical protein
MDAELEAFRGFYRWFSFDLTESPGFVNPGAAATVRCQSNIPQKKRIIIRNLVTVL